MAVQFHVVVFLTSCALLFASIEGGKKKAGDEKIMGLKSAGIKSSGQAGEPAKCQGQDLKLDSLTTAADECKKEMKLTQEAGEKNPCFVACMWKNLGLIEKDMMFTKDVSSFVTSVFPQNAQQAVTDAMLRCEKASSGPLSMDDNCSSFKPMKKCIMKSVMAVCKS